MEQRYVARVPGGLCYQTHAEAMTAASRLKTLSMLLEVRGYWIVLSRETLTESVDAIDNLERERLTALRLIEEARVATEAANNSVVEDASLPPTKVKERKHG